MVRASSNGQTELDRLAALELFAELDATELAALARRTRRS